MVCVCVHRGRERESQREIERKRKKEKRVEGRGGVPLSHHGSGQEGSAHWKGGNQSAQNTMVSAKAYLPSANRAFNLGFPDMAHLG